MASIGYARVSTGEQDAGQQDRQLRAAGCVTVFTETASGADRGRPALEAALTACGPGDVLICVRLDRLARSLAHLLALIARLEERGAGFRSLSDPIDTTSAQGRFTMQILGAVAEFERALIRERTRAGIAAAKARGARPGNPRLAEPEGQSALAQARARAHRAPDQPKRPADRASQTLAPGHSLGRHRPYCCVARVVPTRWRGMEPGCIDPRRPAAGFGRPAAGQRLFTRAPRTDRAGPDRDGCCNPYSPA